MHQQRLAVGAGQGHVQEVGCALRALGVYDHVRQGLPEAACEIVAQRPQPLGLGGLLGGGEGRGATERLRALRDELACRLREAVPDLVVNAEGAERAPHVLNVAVPGADSEALLMHLDLAGVAASGGSACSTGAVEPSHVLVAMGLPRELALGAIRFSLGHESGPEDIVRVAEVMPAVVAKVRKLAGVLGRA